MQKWQDYKSFYRTRIPANVLSWLIDKNSLTARLQRQFGAGSFQVKVIDESNTFATLADAIALGIKPGIRLRVRQVHLLVNKVPVVYARSLIPVTSLTGRLGRLHFQGNKSLGAALFADPAIKRGSIQVALSNGCDIPAAGSGLVWGRRSVFSLFDCPLLVSEFYLPTLIEG